MLAEADLLCDAAPRTALSFVEQLQRLTRRPFVLLGWMLAANALAMPYLGFIHDSRLYSGQVLYRLDPEAWSSDLFFQYGSQDRYSLFSPVMAPIVERIGFPIAFFGHYLLALTLFLFALQRLVLRLVPDSPGAVVGLLYASMVRLPYGGHNVFNVLEPFTTPRLLASALTLLGLAWTLDRRLGRATIAFLLGLGFHPLMTFPGIVLAIAYGIWQRYGGRVLLMFAVVAGASLGVLMAVPALGYRVFGAMDDTWKEVLRATCPYHFAEMWAGGDWFFAAIVIAVGIAATMWLKSEPPLPPFVGLATALGTLGIISTILLMRIPYALPIMGQSYRAMWLPTALAPPLAFTLAWHLWQTNRLIALIPVLLLGLTDSWPLELCVLALAVPIAFTTVRALGVSPEQRGRAVVAGGLLAGFVIWGIFRLVAFLRDPDEVIAQLDPMMGYEVLRLLAGPGLLVVAVVFAMRVAGRCLTLLGTGIALTIFALTWQIGVFAVPRSAAFEDRIDPYRPGIRFVARYLAGKKHAGLPHVYTNLRRVEFVWQDWHACSYFDVNQTAGFLFAKETAVEGYRRAPLAGPFEMDYVRHRKAVLPEGVVLGSQQLFQFSPDDSLRPEHLFRLAAELTLDYIVLWDLDPASELLQYAVAVGPRVAIFDAAELRRAPR